MNLKVWQWAIIIVLGPLLVVGTILYAVSEVFGWLYFNLVSFLITKKYQYQPFWSSLLNHIYWNRDD